MNLKCKSPKFIKHKTDSHIFPNRNSHLTIKEAVRQNEEKLKEIVKNEMELINKRKNQIQDRVKKIDEEVKKIKEKTKLSSSKLISESKHFFTPTLSPIKKIVSSKLSMSKIHSIEDPNYLNINIMDEDECSQYKRNRKLFSPSKHPTENHQLNKSRKGVNQLTNSTSSNLDITKRRSEYILAKKGEKLNTIKDESSSTSHNFLSGTINTSSTILSNRSKRRKELIDIIDKSDPNYKKLLRMKNYDLLVANMVHVSQILQEPQKKQISQKLELSINLNSLSKDKRFENSDVSISNRLVSPRTKSSIEQTLLNNLNTEKMPSPRATLGLYTNNISDLNKEKNKNPLIKLKKIDRFKLKLMELYKIDSARIKELNKIKRESRSLPLEEYQKKLINIAAKYLKGEFATNLSHKFSMIRDQMKEEREEEDLNIENKLKEMRSQIEVAESMDFKNVRDKVKRQKIVPMRKYQKKKKIDDHLKRIKPFIPANLMEKLQAI